jgi:hypothetical protein
MVERGRAPRAHGFHLAQGSVGGDNSPENRYTQNVTSGATALTCLLMFSTNTTMV